MLKQKFILSYASKMFVQFVTIATSIIVARIAGPTVMGTLAWALAYANIIGFIADLGLGTAHIKLISEGNDPDKCLDTFIRLKLITLSIYIFAFVIMFIVRKYIFHSPFESKTHEYVIFIFLIINVLTDFGNIAISTFAGKTEQAKQDIPYIVQNVYHQVLRVIIVLVGGSTIALAFGNLSAAFLILPVYILMMKKFRVGKFDKELAKRYIKIAAPVLVLGAATTLINSVDKVLLQDFSGSEQVGYYTTGYRIGGFILLISRSMGMLFFPMFSSAVARGDFGFIQDKIYKFEKFSFLFLLPFVIIITLFSYDVVILLLGREYLPSINIMSITTVALFLTVFNAPQGNVMAGLGKFKLVAKIAIVNLIIYVILLYLFVNKNFLDLGGLGVAISLLISNTLTGVFYRFYCYRASKLLSNRLAIQFIVYGIINFLISWVIFTNFFAHNGWLRLLFLFLYLVFTYISLILLKWLKKDDVSQLLGLLNMRKMKNYVSGELKSKDKNPNISDEK